MGKYGRVDLRALDHLLPAGALDQVLPLLDEDGLTFGVLLGTGTSSLFAYNWGDELYIEQTLPPHVRESCVTSLPE
jgi:hypothetical protein